MHKSISKRLQTLEAACKARPSPDAQAPAFGHALAVAYGGPDEPVTLAAAMRAADEVYSDEKH